MSNKKISIFKNLSWKKLFLIFLIFSIFGSLFEQVQYVIRYYQHTKEIQISSRTAVIYGQVNMIYGFGVVLFILLILLILITLDALISWTALIRQNHRRKGYPPMTKIGTICDKIYPDEVLKKAYPNMNYKKGVSKYVNINSKYNFSNFYFTRNLFISIFNHKNKRSCPKINQKNFPT